MKKASALTAGEKEHALAEAVGLAAADRDVVEGSHRLFAGVASMDTQGSGSQITSERLGDVRCMLQPELHDRAEIVADGTLGVQPAKPFGIRREPSAVREE